MGSRILVQFERNSRCTPWGPSPFSTRKNQGFGHVWGPVPPHHIPFRLRGICAARDYLSWHSFAPGAQPFTVSTRT
jgi:hypothetical protein